MTEKTQHEDFADAVRAMEKRTSNVGAAAVIDPTNLDRRGRVVISYPKDGAGRLCAIAWLPGAPDKGPIRHAGHANGYGYDKATAAMGGAEFVSPKGEKGKLKDQGYDWRQQLEAAGFVVIQAV